MSKRYLDINVLEAARQRIAWTFDNFERIYLSFSAGKDSTVMLHLAMDEAKRRNRKIGVLLVDLEAQYKYTINHALAMFSLYSEWIDPYWVSLPLNLRNAVSMFEPQWCCWERGREDDWVRQPPSMAITDPSIFPFYFYRMEFEQFVPGFGEWYAQGQKTACLVGIRTDESLNRWRTIASDSKVTMNGNQWTTLVTPNVFNVYPIYDWRTEDIWIYHGKTGLPYNRLYDIMYQAGLSIHQQRICQPYGDDQKKGLWLFHLIEPETWGRVVARVQGANSGALYVREAGSITGSYHITLPPGHTWKSFAQLLLSSMPDKTRDHYLDKITVFLKWWQSHGYPDEIPDAGEASEEADKKMPSWRRICKVLLRNDYWCKGLSFTQTKPEAYLRYKAMMAKRRTEWDIAIMEAAQ